MTEDKSYLITGASRGIGLGLAKYLSGQGAKVFGCSRGENEFTHANYKHFITDVGNEVAVREMFFQIRQSGASVNVLVNNAGLTLNRLALLTDAASAGEVVNTNVVGPFIVMREAIKEMKHAGFGRIVNFSSVNVPLGSVGGAIYNASKAALESLGFTMSRELAGEDITINTLGISMVADTGMVGSMSDNIQAAKKDELIKPDFVKIEEIAHAIDFFAAPHSRNVTNQIIYFGGVR